MEERSTRWLSLQEQRENTKLHSLQGGEFPHSDVLPQTLPWAHQEDLGYQALHSVLPGYGISISGSSYQLAWISNLTTTEGRKGNERMRGADCLILKNYQETKWGWPPDLCQAHISYYWNLIVTVLNWLIESSLSIPVEQILVDQIMLIRSSLIIINCSVSIESKEQIGQFHQLDRQFISG